MIFSFSIQTIAFGPPESLTPSLVNSSMNHMSKKVWVAKTYLDNNDKISTCARALDMELVHLARS